MKKTLLLSTALVVSVAGFAQSTASKAINPKYLQKKCIVAKKILVEPQPTTAKSIKANTAKKGHQSTNAACVTSVSAFTSSWNCFGVGGGSTTSSQNCLSYNPDLNTLMWTQRGSKNWTMVTSSGHMQATIFDAPSGMVKDSIVLYHDITNFHARFPGGVIINPTSNTSNSYTNAIAVGIGQVTDGTNWTGCAYSAKPLWSTSALTHTVQPTGDSLYAKSTMNGKFGYCANSNLTGAPVNDMQYLFDGKTVVSLGTIDDSTITATDQIAGKGAIFTKAVLDNTGKIVNWSYTTLIPPVRKGTLGYQLSEGRMAFGPDNMHGYIVFVGILNTVYNSTTDSAMTPIVYATTDGGTTWTQKLAGYDWMCHHPEVERNVGYLSGTTANPAGNRRYYTFNEDIHSADVTVDKNNMLHFVTCVSENKFVTGSIDSVSVYAPTYDYDYVTHHPIIWDFMTDGTSWSTMMVDSIISAGCGSAATDTTSTHTAMGGSQLLAVSSHITVSRSKDGSKIFYGWADSDPNVTLQVYNVSPDILMKAYDVNTGMASSTKNVTNGLVNTGTCFYPFLSDMSYNDGTNWVVPAVFTTGHIITASAPQTTYDASTHSVVNNIPATDAAFSKAIRVTLVGSITPALSKFS